jgi:hypothetical protein
MTTGGWINLILSVGFVTLLFVGCIWRTFKVPPPRPPKKDLK